MTVQPIVKPGAMRSLRYRYARLGSWDEVKLLLPTMVLLGVILSFALVEGWLPPVLALVFGLVSLVVFVHKPHIGLVSLLIITSSFIAQEALPALTISANFRPSDLILGFLLLLVLFKWIGNGRFGFIHTPLDLPLLLFAISAIVACFTATTSGVKLLLAIPEARYPLYYLVFFAVTNLVRDKQSLKWFVKALFFLATITAIVVIIQAAVGSTFSLISANLYEMNVGQEAFSGINRVEVPGSILVQCMLVAGFAVWIRGKAKVSPLVYTIMLSLILVAVILSFYRTLWVAALLSLGLAFISASNPRKARLILIVLVAVPVLLGSVWILSSFEGKVGTYTRAAVARTTSLVSGEVFVSREDTWGNRMEEARSAIEPILAHPIFGVGFAVPWRSGVIRFTNDTGTFTHNGYAWVLVKMGLLGFIPFLLIILIFTARGFWLWRQVQDPFFQAVSLGFTFAFVGFIFANITEASLISNFKWTTVFGAMMGINEVIFRLYCAKPTWKASGEAEVE